MLLYGYDPDWKKKKHLRPNPNFKADDPWAFVFEDMHAVPDLTGQQFGRLKVLRKKEVKAGYAGRNQAGRGGASWICLCECGAEVVRSNSQLKLKGQKSCSQKCAWEARRKGLT